jgi:hypothetical protein
LGAVTAAAMLLGGCSSSSSSLGTDRDHRRTHGQVREHHDGDAAIFEIITGIADEPGPFATHGHTLRLTLAPPDAS